MITRHTALPSQAAMDLVATFSVGPDKITVMYKLSYAGSLCLGYFRSLTIATYPR